MSASERRKGVRGEREVLELLERAGFKVRGLEAGGDHLASSGSVRLQIETKRTETARPWAWWEQLSRDLVPGALGVVAFRRSRSRWLALVDLEELATLLGALNDELEELR